MAEKKEIEIELGENGAGSHCEDKFMRYAGGGAAAGAFLGSVEACFVNPTPGKTTPLIFYAFKNMVTRSVLLGAAGGAFAVGACFSAKIRDKDDYFNAAVGGMLAGSVFGYTNRSIPVGLRMGVGLAIALGLIKFRTGSYLPPIEPPKESFEVRRERRFVRPPTQSN